MKKVIFLIFYSLLYADVAKIINEITKIKEFKPKFKKIKYYNIFEYKNNSAKNTTKKVFNLKIYAIFQNKVNINGKWLKIGDKINGYKIIKIANNCIYLKQNNKTSKIFIKNNILEEK